MLTTLTILICSTAALAGGFIDAIAGGGGLLTVPALLVCGLPPHMVLGTNKVGAFLGTTVALFNFTRAKLVNWRMVIHGIAFSLGGSWIGAHIAMSIKPEMLARILIFLLPIGMAVTMIPGKKNQNSQLRQSPTALWILLPAVCLCIGIYDGFFGPGTGSFFILALHWIMRQNLLEASGTAKAFNLASNLAGGVSFIWAGAVQWKLGLIMAACLMLGNWLGSNFAIRVGAKAVRRFLLVALGLLMITLIWQQFI